MCADLIQLDSLQADHDPLIGGKAVGLGRLLRHGFPVPPGFVLTVDAYRRCFDASMAADIDALLTGCDEHSDNRAASEQIRALFEARGLDADTRSAIDAAYRRLGDDVPVAVRSSATAEDSADASFAGQQETFLWIRGTDDVCRHVLRCWASLFTAQAIGYRARFGIAPQGLAMAVVVQRMVEADSAGVMFTLDPANGNRDVVYIESAHGLGEAVVRGEVSPDRFHVNTATGECRSTIAVKQLVYRFDVAADMVRATPLDPTAGAQPSLTDTEAGVLTALAHAVEHAFARPMDIEWAIDGDRRPFLLQARPETVWSQRPTRQQIDAVVGRHDDWDPLNLRCDPARHWTTVNVGEALPGVMTPLGWTTWLGFGDPIITDAFYAMGVIARSERGQPPPEQRMLRVFYGRVAVDPMLFIGPGNRIPGTSGRQIAEHIFGEAPADLPYAQTRRRWPIIGLKTGWQVLTLPARLQRSARETDTWWRGQIARIPSLPASEAIALYHDARIRFYDNITLQALTLMCLVQPMYQMLEKLAERTGIGSADALASGYGQVPEVAVVHDMWRASRGECSLEDVLLQHGYHGPLEGEISSKVWREDPTPLRRLLASYATRAQHRSPLARDAERRHEREHLEAAIVASLPRWKRPLQRLLLNVAARRIPLRGVAKNAFLQSLDVARAAARQAGIQMAADGVLKHAEDVFMLTTEELEAGPSRGIALLAAQRRERHAIYRELTIPTVWRGDVVPRVLTDVSMQAKTAASLRGIGVSPGVIEGRARVLITPDFAEVKPDEILVAPTTDPSWSSIMFISAGLVVDIGGAMSHAAVVARELGLPCVVNCLTGTQTIHSGDLLRLDGAAGTVEILERTAT